jgi:signal transduction histidine kinase
MNAAAKMSTSAKQGANADKFQLAAEIVHDFNNILNVISGYLELMQENSSTPEAITRYLAKARQAVANGSSMTSQLASQLHARIPAKAADISSDKGAERPE